MSFNAIYPHKLSLLPPQIDFRNQKFLSLLLKARTELAELKGYCLSMPPNPMLLISPAIIKESVASSNIENIGTKIIDVLQNQLFPETEQREPDKEVLRYRDAVLWGFEKLNSYSMSSRLILGIQKILAPGSAGNYRKKQNQMINTAKGEVLYTPPLCSEVPRLMQNWENFVNQKNDDFDPLIKCAIAHYQFEAVHPFLDGNGRTGRILIVLQLIKEDILGFPILFISDYINKNRAEYYELLRDVTKNENWGDFIFFMLNGFYFQAKETKEMLFKIMKLLFDFKDELKKNHRKIYSADLVESLFSYPIITPVKLAQELDRHYTTTSRYLSELSKAGMLKETRYGKYHFFINEQLIKIVKK